jgi:hypothetical protein
LPARLASTACQHGLPARLASTACQHGLPARLASTGCPTQFGSAAWQRSQQPRTRPRGPQTARTSGQFCVQPCCAHQSAAKVHDQSTETASPLEPHGNVRCQARGYTRAHERVPCRLQQPAAPSRQTPPSAAARAPRREFLPLGRRLALSCGRAALAYNSIITRSTPRRDPKRVHPLIVRGSAT